MVDLIYTNDEFSQGGMVDWSDTLIAVGIYVVDVRNKRLVSPSDIHGTILYVDRVDRRDRRDHNY